MTTPVWIITFEFFIFSMIGWIYSIGKTLNRVSDERKTVDYNEDLWLILYLIFVIPFGLNFRSIDGDLEIHSLIVFVPGLIGLYSIIKLINFSAKALKQHENKKELQFSDYSSDFFLIAFFVIGVWIIQPRLNKIIRK